MKKKIFITLLACFGVLAVIAVIKISQFLALMLHFSSMTLPPESVASIIVQEEEWTPSLKAIGSAEAVQGVIVSTDQPGIVTKINFESGNVVKEGDLLVQIDITQEEAKLRSALAQQRLAALNLERQKNLLKNRVSAQADFDAAQAEYDQNTARVQEVQALIDKKTIKAPFSGVLGIRMVNRGEYLQNGAKVAPLQSLDPIYVNFWLPQQDLGKITAGQMIRVQADGLPGVEFQGQVNAVDSIVDEATRNVRVQATLSNPKALLREGMYVTVEVPLQRTEKVVTLPNTAIQYAPYGDSVFIIEEMKDKDGKSYRGVRQQVVKLGESKGDRIAVLSGLKPGDEVVTAGVFKLRPGAAVQINNTVQPSNEVAPTPQDT